MTPRRVLIGLRLDHNQELGLATDRETRRIPYQPGLSRRRARSDCHNVALAVCRRESRDAADIVSDTSIHSVGLHVLDVEDHSDI
jgi:hypothetical protein